MIFEIVAIIGMVCIVSLLGFLLYQGWQTVESIPNWSCEQLLERIQKDGMKPNYQYDVREWIAKECWK